MDNPAVFTASYSDWRVVKGRKVVQLVFEVPIEAAGHSYNVLGGMPQIGSENWFAIARLKPGTELDAHGTQGEQAPMVKP